MKTILLSVLALTYSVLSYSQVTINEIDADTEGSDILEFLELYAETETSLDGHTLVLFNGSNNTVYNTIDLDGVTITDQYFVIGNEGVANVDIVVDGNTFQNGADAAAIYAGVPDDFTDVLITDITNTLVDLVVYGTNDDDNPTFLSFLSDAPGCAIQLNEDANGNKDFESNSRVPDGGIALCSNDFVQQTPSPGASNIPNCFGGALAFSDESTEITLCIDDDAIELINYSVTGNAGDGSLFIITDEDNIIISTSMGEEIDSSTLPEGVCRIHSVAYTGILDSETLAAGEDALDIATDGDCLSFGTNFLTITRNVCFPDCDGGVVMSDAGDNVIVCLDEDEDVLTFSNSSIAEEDSYAYVITDESNFIISVLAGDSNDFNSAEAGVCRVWGLSYQGNLDASTIEAGDPALGVVTDGVCLELSSNFITVTRQECAPVEGCGNIFFSEYQEGSSNNKALEIYNPTQFPVSLADYQLVNCSNGCGALDTWEFTNDIFGGATIAPGDVFVVAHPDADPAIQAETDVEFQFLSNGDDVFALQRISTMEIIDVIGEQTIDDIGDGWTVSGVENGTQNHTLVRMEAVNEGTSDWTVGQDQWVVLDQDVFENIGSHTIIPCTVNSDPSVFFTAASASVNEDAGTVTIEVGVLNPLDIDMTVEVMLTGGTATTPDDFDGAAFPVTLTFPAGMDMAQTFDITIVDDMMEEGAETIMLELMNATDGLAIGAGMYTLTINPSDVTIPLLTLAEAGETDADGVVVNLDLECEVRAVVYGVNMRGSGLQFTMIDPTDGIGVFSFEETFGYTVTEGDSIHMVGTIGQFNGLAQISPTSIELISSDNMLKEPTVITEFSEATESDLIRIECVSLVDPADWTNDGGGFNVDVTDGTNTFTMRVDAETSVFGTDVPEGTFTLTGIGGQFDSSSPYDEGYQIFPRYIEDVPEGVTADFSFVEANSTGVVFSSENTYEAAPGSVAYFEGDNTDLSYTWEINGTETMGGFVEITVDESWNGVPQQLTITAEGECTATATVDIEFLWLGVEEYQLNSLTIYPNPATENLIVEAPQQGLARIYSSTGKLVKEVSQVNPGQETINVSDLSTGVYFLELLSGDTAYRAQFIKK
ncbi:MAG: lamin tail domain-containing protein [Flavobacteriales bacterium]